MTSLRDMRPLERVSLLDFLLPQRWARRLATRIAKHERRFSGLFGTGGVLTDLPGVWQQPNVLGGLEVSILGSGELVVTPGQALIYPANVTSPGSFLPRPATYTFQDPVPGITPARPEADDDETRIYENPYIRPVPFTISGPLAAEEWWIVYAVPALATTETDTSRVVFNEVTGAWDAAAIAKVTRFNLTVGLARGPSSAGFPAIPAGAFPLAAIHLYAFETDLSEAHVFDLRTLRHPSREPNQIGGCWRVHDHLGDGVWSGHVWAHHRGELLEARAGAIETASISSPGASWDIAASPSAPKIAWLYLARAGGLVPRLKQVGSGRLTDSTTTNHGVYQQGVLVLSPIPPKLGLGLDRNTTAERWDLRSSAPIPLPSYRNDGSTPRLVYDFAGQSALEGEAICVGMVIYDGIVGGTPKVRNISCDAGGWHRGPGIVGESGADVAAHPIANAVDQSSGSTARIGVKRASVGDFWAPFDAVEAVVGGTYTDVAVAWDAGGASGTSGAQAVYLRDVFSSAFPAYSVFDFVTVASGTVAGAGPMPVGPQGMWVGAVRMPYGIPLHTDL